MSVLHVSVYTCIYVCIQDHVNEEWEEKSLTRACLYYMYAYMCAGIEYQNPANRELKKTS